LHFALFLSLSLFVFRIFITNDVHPSLAANGLAMLAYLFYWCTYFHPIRSRSRLL